jgi:molybdopterin synthase sulfur carrier subunit
VKILYFAWLKEKIGRSDETIDPPAHVSTVGALLDWLADRGPEFADALKDRDVVRVAVNQEHAQRADPISSTDEVALFPPVTGG